METLVIGGTGTIGKEVVQRFKEAGHSVKVGSRNASPAIDMDNPKSIEDYFNDVADLDAIICVAGNASFGKFEDMTADQINLGINSKLLGQLNIVQKGMSKLKPGGVMVLTGGMLAYSPWPETSNIAMVNAGLEGLVKAVALELDNDKRIVIVHPPLVRETAEMMGMDGNPWPPAKTVAETFYSTVTNTLNGAPVFVNGYTPENN